MSPEEQFAAQMAKWRKNIRPEVVALHVQFVDELPVTDEERELFGSATPAEVAMAATVLHARADRATEAAVEWFRAEVDSYGGEVKLLRGQDGWQLVGDPPEPEDAEQDRGDD